MKLVKMIWFNIVMYIMFLIYGTIVMTMMNDGPLNISSNNSAVWFIILPVLLIICFAHVCWIIKAEWLVD